MREAIDDRIYVAS